jgi:hypothetical protein
MGGCGEFQLHHGVENRDLQSLDFGCHHGATEDVETFRMRVLRTARDLGGQIQVGQTFGRWTVIGRGEPDPGHCKRWRVRCECGALGLVRGDSLAAGTSKSCRCLQRDLVAAQNVARRYLAG